MINLIIKDISFNIRQVCIGILLSIAFSMIILDGESFSMLAMLMIPSLLFSFTVTKMCFVEDNKSVYNFLMTLPIKKEYIVISKYIENILVFVVSYFILWIANYVVGIFTSYQYDLTSYIIILVFGITNIYNSVYLFINFKYGYAHAQKAVFVLLILYFGAIKGYSYLKSSRFDSVLENQFIIGFGVGIISILFSTLMCVLSIKSFENKN